MIVKPFGIINHDGISKLKITNNFVIKTNKKYIIDNDDKINPRIRTILKGTIVNEIMPSNPSIDDS